ncbi:MAG: efflux transporter outer membrane subunit [Myxococcales bacterium]|nr:efflux transporter outer membrane subunit [Myxococcales bacterium]
MKVMAPLVLGACLFTTGCLMKDVDKDPRPPVAIPEAFAGDASEQADPGPWWESFGDPELARLVDEALKHNFQMQQAWARIEQAEALERMAGAGMYPRVDASLSAGRNKSAPRVFNLGGTPQTIPGVEQNNFSASLPVSYEVDLWGRVRAGLFAAEQDTEAARADLETTAMTIAANVTERWFDVIEQRALVRLIDEQLEVGETNLELTMLRFREGDAAISDVYQQQQQQQQLEAQREGVKLQEQLASQQLAVLLGKPPSRIAERDRADLPPPPAAPQTGIPAAMLERRPDLRAAKARLVAADYRVAQAIAARLPALTLSGSIGLNSPSLSDFFTSFIWSLTAGLAGTIWDGGRLDADIDRNEALVKERVAAYGQALLTALVEVESALAQERLTRSRIEVLRSQRRTARATLDASRRRFQAGIGTYLATLTALRSLQQAEQGLLSAERQLLSARVQVYRALGSHWTKSLTPPDDGEEKPEARPEGEKAPS